MTVRSDRWQGISAFRLWEGFCGTPAWFCQFWWLVQVLVVRVDSHSVVSQGSHHCSGDPDPADPGFAIGARDPDQ
ncbi:MAG: hypothetical protein ACKOXO_08245 [Cyanobium sp.]